MGYRCRWRFIGRNEKPERVPEITAEDLSRYNACTIVPYTLKDGSVCKTIQQVSLDGVILGAVRQTCTQEYVIFDKNKEIQGQWENRKYAAFKWNSEEPFALRAVIAILDELNKRKEL